jgi:hypothetical protein
MGIGFKDNEYGERCPVIYCDKCGIEISERYGNVVWQTIGDKPDIRFLHKKCDMEEKVEGTQWEYSQELSNFIKDLVNNIKLSEKDMLGYNLHKED